MNKLTYKIPFSAVSGELESYPSGFRTEWKENFVFNARLTYNRYGRGRSSALIYLEDLYTRLVYPMFMSTFDDLMKLGRASIRPDGSIMFTGNWTFCKKGQNYALKATEEPVSSL